MVATIASTSATGFAATDRSRQRRGAIVGGKRRGLASDEALVFVLGRRPLRIESGPGSTTDCATGEAVLVALAAHAHRLTATGPTMAIAGCTITSGQDEAEEPK